MRAQALFATDATTLALSVAPGLQLFGLAGSSASALQKPSVLFRRGSDPVCSPGTKCSGLREALMPRTRPGGNLSPLALCLVILNCISGTALLCVPWAFAQAGEVVAALTLLVLGLVSAWTGTELLCAASRLGARSMKEVVSLATGSWVLGKAAGASVAVILIGALCANAAFIGSAAADIRLALSGRRTTEAEAQGMVLCIAGTALVLGSAFTGQAAYSRAASLNPLGLLFLLGVVLVKCLDTLVLGVDRAAAAAGTAAHPAPVAVGSAPGMAPGVFLFAFMSHPVLIELASLLRPPREADGEGGGSPYTTPPHSPRLPPASPLSPPPKSPARAPYSPPPVEKKASPIVLPPGAPQLTVEVPTDDAMPALTDACCGAIGPKLAAAFAALPPAAPPLFVAYSINASVLLLVGTLGASALGERVAPNVLHEFASDGFALAARCVCPPPPPSRACVPRVIPAAISPSHACRNGAA